jgi:F-type H+-transporting ATPase subunit delta
MAVHSRASLRYARALLIAADDTGHAEDLTVEVNGVRDLIATSPDLDSFLDDPTVEVATKRESLARIFEEKLSPLMWRFIDLLVAKRREPILPEILEAAHSMLEERAGRVEAEVRTATKLSDEQQTKLIDRLETITGKDVSLIIEDAPDLVAGFVARVGDTVYDASLGAQLARIGSRLRSADLTAATRDLDS